jgi:hypothetical protein
VKQSTGTQSGNMVIRAFTGNAKILPGAYKTSVLAQVRHEHSDQGIDLEAGLATDSWEVRDGIGGFIQAQIRYRRGAVSRATVEQKMFSPSQPDFYRIYRIDQGTEIIRSGRVDVDRVDSFG